MEIASNYNTINAHGRTVIGGGNGCPRTSGSFSSILQEQILKSMSSDSSESNEKASPVVNFNLTGMELTNDINLFEMLWGNKQDIKA